VIWTRLSSNIQLVKKVLPEGKKQFTEMIILKTIRDSHLFTRRLRYE